MQINQNFLKLKDSYLFSQIAQKVKDYKAENPDKEIIRLGIGDVTLPLVPAVVSAMEKAVLEMGKKETFMGYGEEQGYSFYDKQSAVIIRKGSRAFRRRGFHK